MGTDSLLLFRQSLVKFYKNYETIILLMVKFIIVTLSLTTINTAIGVSVSANNLWVTMGIASIGAVVQPSTILCVLMGIVVFQLLNISLILGAVVAVICILSYVMYIRLFTQETILIMLTLLLIPTGTVYLVPLVAPLFFGIGGIGGIMFGCLFYYTFDQFHFLMSNKISELSIDTIELVVMTIADNTLFNTEMLATITVLSIVYTIVYVIKIQPIDYASYIAVGIGGVINVLGFLISHILLGVNINIATTILFTILSVAVGCIFVFMSVVLDYSRAEMVQFEDESNYYYVKVVPKIEVNAKQAKTQKVYGGQFDDQQESL
ncbi:MAG: hypothetical protein ATN35_00345 [Epulopiscium sp. Nele67-Bin004]|nr:MAG: hypothetical protein ATN35_00345 [Epulopiscium sp. Nele67-Bin004]